MTWITETEPVFEPKHKPVYRPPMADVAMLAAAVKVTPLPPLDHLRIVEAATHQWLERERARLARSQAECLRLERELKQCRDEIAALSESNP